MSLLVEMPATEALPLPAGVSDLLDLPEVRDRLFKVPVEAYRVLTEGRPTELLRGIIIEKMGKTPLHRLILDRLHKILLRQISPAFQLYHQDPLTFIDSEPEPDLAVVAGTEADFALCHPATGALVIEVAVSTLSTDRFKAAIYAEAEVTEYWIVRPEKRQLEVYRQPSLKGYLEKVIVVAPAVVIPVAVPGVSVDLAELFA